MERAISCLGSDEAVVLSPMLENYRRCFTRLPAGEQRELLRLWKLLAEFDWPQVLRVTEQSIAEASPGAAAFLSVIRDICLAIGFPADVPANRMRLVPITESAVADESSFSSSGVDGLAHLAALVVGGTLVMTTFDLSMRPMLRAIRKLATSMGGEAQCPGLYGFLVATEGPLCPFLNLSGEWAKAITRLEKAYAAVTTDAAAQLRRGFAPFEFEPFFRAMCGDEACKAMEKIRGMVDVKRHVQALMKSVLVDLEHKIPFNGFGHFVFVGNPGLGKSEVAGALVEVLRGVSDFAKQLESGNPEDLELARLALEAARDPTRHAELAEAKQRSDERRMQQEKEEARRRKLANGRSATTPEEEAIKIGIEVGSLIAPAPGFSFGLKVPLAVVSRVDHSDNTIKVMGSTASDTSSSSSWKTFKEFTPVTAEQERSLLPLAPTDIGCGLRCRQTTVDNSASLVAGTVAIVTGPGRLPGTINMECQANFGDPSNFNSWSTLQASNFEPITHAEVRACLAVPLPAGTIVTTRGEGGLHGVVRRAKGSDRSVVWFNSNSGNDTDVPTESLVRATDAPVVGKTTVGCLLRCRMTCSDNGANLVEGCCAVVTQSRDGGKINVLSQQIVGGPFSRNWGNLDPDHFTEIPFSTFVATQAAATSPSMGSIVSKGGDFFVVTKYNPSDDTVKVAPLAVSATVMASIPKEKLTVLEPAATPVDAASASSPEIRHGSTVRVRESLEHAGHRLAAGSRGIVTATIRRDAITEVANLFVQRSPDSEFIFVDGLPTDKIEAVPHDMFVASLFAQPSRDADVEEESLRCMQGHVMTASSAAGICDHCNSREGERSCDTCGERCCLLCGQAAVPLHTGVPVKWEGGFGVALSVKGGLVTVARAIPPVVQLGTPLQSDSWINFGKLRIPSAVRDRAFSSLRAGCLVRSTFTGDDRGASMITGAVGIVMKKASDDAVEVFIQRKPHTREFTNWTIKTRNLEPVTPSVYEAGLVPLAQPAASGPSAPAPTALAVGVKVRANKTTSDHGADLIEGSEGVIKKFDSSDSTWLVTIERTPGGPTTDWWLSAANLDIVGAGGSSGSESRGGKANLKFLVATGSQLLLKGPKEFQKLLDDMTAPDSPGGVLFVDEAYQLSPGRERDGAQIINLLMDAMERHRRKLSVIVAGYEDQIDELMGFNAGMRGRFGHEVKFRDYTEGELHEFIYMFVATRSHNMFRIAEGHEQAAAIIARRLSRGANQKHFANARLVRNMVDAALQRAKDRLFDLPVAQRRLELTWSDLLGTCPLSELRHNYGPIVQLERMVGFPGIKRQLLDVLIQVVDLQVAELQGERIVEVKLNQRIYGNPGTGKTTLARIYAHVLCDLGLTVKKDVFETTPNKLKGDAVGEAEKLVRSMMEAAREKVLFIDEAYELYDDSPYSKAMMDALVSEIADTPAFRPIIVTAGYKDRMEEMLTKANPGLYRRLAPNPALTFEGDFSDADLALIVSAKIAEKTQTRRGELATRDVVEHAVKLLALQRQRPAFGNGGAVDNLVTVAVASMLARRGRTLTKLDFGRLPASDDVSEDGGRLLEWFLAAKDQCARARRRGVAVRLPFLWLFSGPPGTGRRQHAKQLMKMMSELEAIGSQSFKEMPSSALVGQFVGQSTPKLYAALKEQLGGLLLVTRADNLLSSSYGQEVFRQLFDMLASPEFCGKIVVVLTAPEDQVDALLALEPSAASKTEMVAFPAPTVSELVAGCWRHVEAQSLPVRRSDALSSAFAEAISSIRSTFDASSFGNYRVAEQLVLRCDSAIGDAPWTPAEILRVAPQLYNRKRDRRTGDHLFRPSPYAMHDAPAASATGGAPPPVTTKATVRVKENEKEARDDLNVRIVAQPPPGPLEPLAAILEELVAAGKLTQAAAIKIAGSTDPSAADLDMPSEVTSFLRAKGLSDDDLRSQLKSMQTRMRDAKQQNLTVCPICFLPEDAARQIGCPWRF